MAGKILDVFEGKGYRVDLAKLKVQGLNEAIHKQRRDEPLEGVEIKTPLWVGKIVLPVHEEPFRYLFARRDNKVFLFRVQQGMFAEPEIVYFAELAAKFDKH